MDTFHDLLPDVATLTVVQRAFLSGFLRQIALADVVPETGAPVQNAVPLKRLGSHGSGSGRDQRVPYRSGVIGMKPYLVTGVLRR